MRPTLILLPGLLNDRRLWQAQREGLRDVAEVRIADLTQDDSVEAMARRVLDTAPEHFLLGGLSMGGYVALEIMRQQPARVSRLALFDTSARPDAPEQRRRRQGLLAICRANPPERFRGVTPRLLPELVHADHVGGPVGEVVMAMARELGRDVFIRQQTAILGRPDFRPGLPAIAVPTLVAVGEDDRVTPPERSREMASLIPGARYGELARCGHLPPMEAPEAVTALLRGWLAD
ncbi:alpha/beta fold hydrolase [Roseomonas elaeocarpi]|uniref:Alpha/beta fold hydrolase n=1 Tax=Roseomonas elaeocarpi TaxID=907779 RepID=A0ABV6JUD4_9PROT